jgi:hypothetical protein
MEGQVDRAGMVVYLQTLETVDRVQPELANLDGPGDVVGLVDIMEIQEGRVEVDLWHSHGKERLLWLHLQQSGQRHGLYQLELLPSVFLWLVGVGVEVRWRLYQVMVLVVGAVEEFRILHHIRLLLELI